MFKDKNGIKYQIISFLHGKKIESQTDGFVVGISGGIDSALTSTLCALTGQKTYVVSMPINKPLNDNVYKHLNFLKKNYTNVEFIEKDLTDICNNYKNINSDLTYKNKGLSDANMQSRIRMVELYYIANTYNCLVVGTGNKCEDFGVGFFTKYGDGGVDILPIGDLYKSEVYELSDFLGIDEDILNAQPTDGLWSDERTDEDQIGLSYDEIEDIMENGKNANISFEKCQKFYNLHYKNKHKTEEIPIFKITK